MLALLAIVPDWVKLPAAMIIGGALVFYPAKWMGKAEGRQAAATASLEKSVEILRARNVINEEVSASDASGLCRSLGLPDEQITECMRRVVDANPDTRNRR